MQYRLRISIAVSLKQETAVLVKVAGHAVPAEDINSRLLVIRHDYHSGSKRRRVGVRSSVPDSPRLSFRKQRDGRVGVRSQVMQCRLRISIAALVIRHDYHSGSRETWCKVAGHAVPAEDINSRRGHAVPAEDINSRLLVIRHDYHSGTKKPCWCKVAGHAVPAEDINSRLLVIRHDYHSGSREKAVLV
ncbi:hypothetical protein J6590_032057 [Homalodisca vitripennis]|nr:hypothetical protein J6590_032057 [Homalodisca vitripennis]